MAENVQKPPGTVEDLGKKVKAQHPGKYDDLSDVELGRKVRAKYPEYRDFTDVEDVAQRPANFSPAPTPTSAPQGVVAEPMPSSTGPATSSPAAPAPSGPGVPQGIRIADDYFKQPAIIQPTRTAERQAKDASSQRFAQMALENDASRQQNKKTFNAIEASATEVGGSTFLQDPASTPFLSPQENKVLLDYESTLPAEQRAYMKSKREQDAWTSRDQAELEFNALRYAQAMLNARTLTFNRQAEAAIDQDANYPVEPPSEQEAADITAGNAFVQQQLRTLVRRHPEYAMEVANQRSNQAVADVQALADPQMAAYYNLVQPTIHSLDQFAANILRTPRTFGDSEYGWTDALADWAEGSMEGIRSTEPSAVQGPLTLKNAIPKAVGAVTSAAMLGATSPGGVGLVANSFVQTNADYFKEAQDAGLSKEQATEFATGAAALTSLLELVAPNDYVKGSVKRSFQDAAVKAIAGGAVRREALKEGLTAALREGGEEFSQEAMQYLADKGVSHLTNSITGAHLDDEVKLRELAENATLGFIAGGLLAGTSAAGHPYRQAAIDYAVRNPQETLSAIQAAEFLSDEQKAMASERVQSLSKMYKGNGLMDLDADKAEQAADALERKKQLEKDIAENPMDPAIEAAEGDPRKAGIEEATRTALEAKGITGQQQTDALVGAKIIEPELDADGKPIKPKKVKPKLPTTQENTNVSQGATSGEGILRSDVRHEQAQPSGGVLPVSNQGSNLGAGSEGSATTDDVAPQEVNAVTNGPVSPEVLSTPNEQPTTDQASASETPAAPPDQGGVSGEGPDSVPAQEEAGPRRAAPEPVEAPTVLLEKTSKDKKRSTIEYAIPGYEEYRTVAVKGPGGWKVVMPLNAEQDIFITSKTQPTAKLAIGYAKELLDKAGKEKLEQVIARSYSTEQASPIRRERLAIAPMQGMVRERSRVLKDLSKGVGRRITYGKTQRGTSGTYSPSSAAVRIRMSGDLDTIAHEVGHAIDDKFAIVKQAQQDAIASSDLEELADHGSTPPANHPSPQTYREAEGMAEFMRALVMDPDGTKANYPGLYAIYERHVDAKTKAALSAYSDDVRSLAGATGRDIILSNIQADPSKSNSVLKDLFAKDSGFSITFADKMKARFVDPLKAFSRAIEYASDIKGEPPLVPSKDPYMLARLLLHINGKTSEVLESGMIDSHNQVITDSDGKAMTVDWLLEPFDHTDEGTLMRDMDDAMAYMVAERTVELAGRFGREEGVTGIGAGLFKDVDVAKKALEEIASDPKRLAMVQEAARRYREMANATLEYLRDKGRISEETYDDIKKNNVQYVALQRVMEAAPDEPIEPFIRSGGGNIGSVAQPIRTIKGSSRVIQNPYVSLLDGVHKSIKEADRNEVMRTFTDLLRNQRQMYEGQPLPLSEVGAIGKPGDKNSVTVFVDGKPETWVFQKDVYEALKGLDHEGYKLPAIVRALPQALRWTVTHFPVFAARNIVRDIQSRLMLSNSYSLSDQLKGKPFRDLIGNKEHWREVARAGGLNAGFYTKDAVHYYGLMQEAVERLAKDKRFILGSPARLKGLWHAYENALYKSETVGRVAEYRAAFRKAKAEGMDDYNAQLYAAFRSSDLIDFALAGHWMRVANQVIPFSNAQVQGLRSAVVHAKEDPIGFSLRIMLYGVLPSVLIWWMNHQDDETAKEYEDLPAYQRDMFYNLKVGPNKWLSIPKAFELSLPGAAVDRMLSATAGKKNAFDGYAGSVVNSLLPDEAAVAGPLRPVVEGLANYDFYRGKSIVPPEEQKLRLELRNTKGASRAAQVLQDAVGVDARHIDHFLQTQFSYFGKTGTKLSDLGREDGRNQFGLEDLGFFKGTPAYNSAIVTDFIKYAQEYGLTSSKEYKELRSAANAYFAAKSDKEKDQAARSLREAAAALMPLLEQKGQAKLQGAEQ